MFAGTMLSKLRYNDSRAEFDLKATRLDSLIPQLRDRELLYELSISRKVEFDDRCTMAVSELAPETTDVLDNSDIIESIAKDMPAFMVSNIVFSDVSNVSRVEAKIGDMVVTTLEFDGAVGGELKLFSGDNGYVLPSGANSDMRLVFYMSDSANARGSFVLSAITTYVLMSKIISSQYTHTKTLHIIPFITTWNEYTFLFDTNGIAFYNTPVAFDNWKKTIAVEEYPFHTVSDEYQSVEMDITDPVEVLGSLPGFDPEAMNINITDLKDAGKYRVPININESDAVTEYLSTNSNVKSFVIKSLAFIGEREREKNLRHCNEQTVNIYNYIDMLFNDDTSLSDNYAEGFSES